MKTQMKTVGERPLKKMLSAILFVLLLVTSAYRCKAQCTLQLQVPPVMYVCGPCPWQINANVIGGTAPYTYLWSDGTTLPFLNTCAPGVYTVVVWDANACADTATVSVVDIGSLNISLEVTPPSCPSTCDGSVILHGLAGLTSNGYFVEINGIFNGNDSIINFLCPGASIIDVLTNGGCYAAELINLEAPSCFCDSFAPLGCINTCEFNQTNYTAPFHNGSTWQWVVNGALSYTANANAITVTWNDDSLNNSYGTIQYLETKANGDVDSTLLCYNIGDAPAIDFTTTPLPVNGVIEVCAGSPVTFNNLTTGATKHLWDFGNGNTSSAVSPSFSFNQTGLFKVSYTATNGCQCAASDSIMVNVRYAPGPDVQCASVVCANDTATYNTSVICGTYSWSVTGGTIISSQPYSNAIVVAWGNGSTGNGSVTLDVGTCTGLCATPTTITIPIVSSAASISGDSYVCVRDFKTYSVPAIPGTTFTWSITPSGASIVSGYGTNSILVDWGVAGNYTVSVNYDFELLGCSGTGSYNVTVSPEISVYGDANMCLNTSTSFTANVQGYSGNYDWIVKDANGNTNVTTGGSNFNFYPLAAGNYTITATPDPFAAGISCNDSATVSISVTEVPKPLAIAGETVICPGGINEYTATGMGGNMIFEWYVLGGSPATITGNVITVQWNANGPYRVSLSQKQAQSPQCESDTISLQVNSYVMPAITGPMSVCANAQSSYNLQGGGKPGVYYEWSVTPTLGSIVSGQGTSSVIVEWLNAQGNATIDVIATNCDSQTSSLQNIQVQLPAAPLFSPANPTLCTGSFVTVTGSASSSTYTWTDSIGNLIGNNQTINISYGGNFTLTADDANGCTSDTSFYVNSNPLPDASITTPDGNVFCIPLPINATVYALVNSGYTYQWYQNSTAIPNATTPVYIVTQASSYYVVVTNSFGCTKASGSIPFSQQTCNPGNCNTSESIDFTHSPCDEIQFTGLPSSTAVVMPTWNFDDPASGSNNIASGFSVTHDFTSAGYYRVSISAQAPNTTPPPSMCAVGMMHVVPVYANADFKFIEACAGAATSFIDLSTWLPSYNISSWSWDFGDASSASNLQNPSHTYTTPGTYNVTLTIVSTACTSIITKLVNIPGVILNGSYSPLAICEGTPISFTGSALTNGLIEDWLWSYGDGTTSANQNPMKTFTSAGVYQITANATDNAGCTAIDTFSINVSSTPAPGTITPPGPIANCGLVNNTLIAPTGTAWLWNNGDVTQNIQATHAGNYNVEVTTAGNCRYLTPEVMISLTPAPKALIISGNHYVCYPNSLVMECYTEPGCNYEWFKAGNPNSISLTYMVNVPYANAAGQYYLVATNTLTGCKDTSDLFVVVTPVLDAAVTTQPGGVNCQGTDVTITVNNPVVGNTYTWTNGTVQDFIGGSAPSITTSIAGTYYVTVSDTLGCSLKSLPVEVSRGPDFSNVLTGCYEFCDTSNVVLHALGNAGLVQWLMFTTGGWAVVSNNPNYTLTTDGLYKLVLTTFNGCTDTSDILSVNQYHCCDLNAVATSTMPACFGDSTGTATVVSPTGAGVNYYWTTGSNAQTVTGLPAGTIYVTVQTGPFCKDQVPVQIIAPPPVPVPTISHIADTLYSSVDDSIFSYQWFNYGQLIPGANAMQYVNSDSGCYTVMISDPNGCFESSDTMCIYTGIESLPIDGETLFVVYPNPFEQYIIFESSELKAFTATIFDVAGRIVEERNVKGRTIINAENLAPAVYTFTIAEKNVIKARGKLMKRK